MKHKLILLFLLSLAPFSLKAQSLEQALNECKTITESDLKRLMCYDAIQVSAAELAKVKKIAKPDAQFGLKKVVENKEPELITATVSKINKNAYGKLTIYLENGQVWKQSDSTSISIKVDNTIVIKQGALDSYNLKKQGSNRAIKVKRVK